MEAVSEPTILNREISFNQNKVGEKLLGFDEKSQSNYLKPEFADLFEKDSKPWNTTISEAISTSTEHINENVIKKDLDPSTNLNRLRTWEYILLYRYIVSSNTDSGWDNLSEKEKHTLANSQNETMNTLHKTINKALKDYLTTEDSEPSKQILKTLEENESHENANLGNIKVFRGLFCNANCLMCFQENSADEKVDAFVKGNRPLEYTPDQLTRSLLYSRAAYRLREVSYTGGETLVNKPKQFASEVALAKELGYPQISTMSNGRLMTQETLKELAEAGLTHVIISIHTVDPLTHYKILNWKDARRPIVKAINEEGEGLPDDEKSKLLKFVTQKFLGTKELGELPDNLTETADKVVGKVKTDITKIYEEIIQNIRDAAKLEEKFGTKVRLNISYNPDTIGTDLAGVLAFATDLGAHEVTLIEMIPGNDKAIEMHTPLPTPSDFAELGYEPLSSRDWGVGGIGIYKSEGKPTFATCNFGQLNQLTMAEGDERQYADFGKQEKEVVLHPKGTLSSATYESKPILYWS